MLRRSAAGSVLVLLVMLSGLFSFARPSLRVRADNGPSAKKKVKSASDLPRFSYAVSGSASALLQADDATFGAFASKVRADVDGVLRDYEIDDKSTLRRLLGAKADLEEIAGEREAALKAVDELRSLEEKPSAKLTTGLFARARLQAAIDAKSDYGAAFDEAFSKNFRAAVDALPWDVVQDWARGSYVGARVFSKSAAVGGVMTDLDPAVQKSGTLDNAEAWDLIGVRNTLQFALPVDSLRATVLREYIAAHNVMKPDIWAARDVTLTNDQKLAPVLVAIWDSGVDVSLFPNQLFTDPNPTASGTHGLAYDDQGAASTSWLYPLTPEQEKVYPKFRSMMNGRLDLEAGKETPDAQEFVNTYRSMTPDQLHELFHAMDVLDFYAHGTHCAGIAVRGNSAARLVVARFNDQLPDYTFPPTMEWVKKLGADFQQMSDYFRTRNVRVVNMSWGDQPDEFEMWLSKTGGGADPAERKKKATELYAAWREAVETAIKNAPGTLFITAAGNSDSNAGFVEDVPASLHLPNLIAVGAVNQAGDETDFTSYGDTVVVDADGFEVESYVPGGARVRFSGTSMASPNVVNLAAKLFALDPSLTPEQAIDLIRKGATTSEDGRRHLIDEKKSVALLKEQEKK